ncbi:MAG: toxin-antitoxin system HicB family antitoxin, partial [Clostridia bacterium]
PEKAYKGSFNIRVSPELHKRAAIYAIANDMTLNHVVEDALEDYVVAHG